MRATKLSASPRWGNSGKLDPVAVRIAPRLGVTAATAEQLMRGPQRVNERCAAIVRGFVELGDERRLAAFLAPIRVAEAGVAPMPLTSDLYAACEEAFAGFCQRQLEYRRAPDAAKAQTLLRALDALTVAAQRLRQSLKQRHELGGA